MEENALTDTAREVTSGPACPRCHFPMEPGYLTVQVPGARGGGQFVWCDRTPADDGPGAVAAELWASTHGGHGPSLKGYRCPECEYLELGYGKSGLTRAGWSASGAGP